MSGPASVSNRQKLADRYLRAADAGTLALIGVFVIAALFYGPDGELDVPGWLLPIIMIVVFTVMGAFAYMFFRRGTDDFTLGMWHSGVTLAFFAIIAWSLFGLLIESTIEGLLRHPSDVRPHEERTVSGWTTEIALTAYFIGFHFKRFRGNF
ncbi:hypothetical protein [Aurantiacibacter marinus]|uniref:Uncharacterized protein n=1 Tax=Aurantiacibacter marinus TaxID=874156 RepID=A0A0H0XUF8_9SPHN|nr:hypothetical protein [Aurantiacibacter marinus]KLI63910.1 hypothetical protein AAV99_09455 [Aurantiacibacter marinus]